MISTLDMNSLTSMEQVMNSPWFWLAIVWSIAWKAWALWRAAKNNDLIWYLVMMVVNTLGLIEIVYIFLFSNKKLGRKSS